MENSEKEIENSVFEKDYLNEMLQEEKESDLNAINMRRCGKNRKKQKKERNCSGSFWMYEKGEGRKQDYDPALKLYPMSAEQNFPKAIIIEILFHRIFLKGREGLQIEKRKKIPDCIINFFLL